MVYGLYNKTFLNEDNDTHPFGDYGKTKVIAETLLQKASKCYKFNCTIFRPRLILGPSRLGILKNMFDLIRFGLPVPIIGKGENFFQFVSVDECAKASLLAADLGCPSDIYNLGSVRPYKIKKILMNLISHYNSKSVLLPLPKNLLLKF